LDLLRLRLLLSRLLLARRRPAAGVHDGLQQRLDDAGQTGILHLAGRHGHLPLDRPGAYAYQRRLQAQLGGGLDGLAHVGNGLGRRQGPAFRRPGADEIAARAELAQWQVAHRVLPFHCPDGPWAQPARGTAGSDIARAAGWGPTGDSQPDAGEGSLFFLVFVRAQYYANIGRTSSGT